MEGREGEEGLGVVPAPHHAAHAAQGGERDVAHVGPRGLEHAHARLHVLQVVDADAPAGQGDVLQHGLGFGHDLPPALARGVLEVHGQHPPVGGVPVGLQVERVPRQVREEARLEVVDDRDHGAAPLQVLEVDLALGPGRAVEDDDLQVAPVLGQPRADDLLLAVALAEDQRVLGGIGPQAVLEDARALGRLARVVEGALVGGEGNAAVAALGQRLAHLLARVDVEQLDRHFVLAALAHAVHDAGAVVRDVEQVDGGPMVGGQGVRVEQDLVRAVQPAAHVDHEEVLVRTPLGEEIAAPGLARDVGDLHPEQLAQAPAQRAALGAAAQQGLCVAVLRVDPGPGVGALLVLQPTVRIHDLDAVHLVAHLHPARLGCGGGGASRRGQAQRGRDKSEAGGRQEGGA